VTMPTPPFEELVRDLGDRNRHARCRAARSLGEGRDPRAVEPLLRALADPAGDVRAKVAAALGRLRDPRAIGPLLAAMRDDKVSVRAAATAAVKKFGKRAYPPLLEAYRGSNGSFRRTLIGALASYKTPAVSELLIAALDDPDRDLHQEVVRLLGRRKDRRALERLLDALAEAREGLDRALQVWNAMESERSPSIEYHRVELAEWAEVAPQLLGIIWALGEIGDARAFTPLQELLEIGESRIVSWIVPDIIRALRRIDNPRAVDLVHGLLDDPCYPGRDWLAMTLAGMDLMNATQSLRVSANRGDLGTLLRALQAARIAQEELHSQIDGLGDSVTDAGEISRHGTDLMRRLEAILRGFGQGQSEP
jgi:HEAT repeat protein